MQTRRIHQLLGKYCLPLYLAFLGAYTASGAGFDLPVWSGTNTWTPITATNVYAISVQDVYHQTTGATNIPEVIANAWPDAGEYKYFPPRATNSYWMTNNYYRSITSWGEVLNYHTNRWYTNVYNGVTTELYRAETGGLYSFLLSPAERRIWDLHLAAMERSGFRVFSSGAFTPSYNPWVSFDDVDYFHDKHEDAAELKRKFSALCDDFVWVNYTNPVPVYTNWAPVPGDAVLSNVNVNVTNLTYVSSNRLTYTPPLAILDWVTVTNSSEGLDDVTVTMTNTAYGYVKAWTATEVLRDAGMPSNYFSYTPNKYPWPPLGAVVTSTVAIISTGTNHPGTNYVNLLDCGYTNLAIIGTNGTEWTIVYRNTNMLPGFTTEDYAVERLTGVVARLTKRIAVPEASVGYISVYTNRNTGSGVRQDADIGLTLEYNGYGYRTRDDGLFPIFANTTWVYYAECSTEKSIRFITGYTNRAYTAARGRTADVTIAYGSHSKTNVQTNTWYDVCPPGSTTTWARIYNPVNTTLPLEPPYAYPSLYDPGGTIPIQGYGVASTAETESVIYFATNYYATEYLDIPLPYTLAYMTNAVSDMVQWKITYYNGQCDGRYKDEYLSRYYFDMTYYLRGIMDFGVPGGFDFY